MLLLVAFLSAALANAQLDAQAPAILQGPVSQIVDEQRTVTFSCTAKAEDIKWIINGSQLESSAYDSAIDLRRIPSDVLFYSSVTFPPVSQQYHSTRVRCQAMHQQNIVESPDAYLTITDTNRRDDERDDCSKGAGSDSWHIAALSAAMAVYVALTTPLVIVLAAMYIVRQRKETSKVAQRRQVEDAKNQNKGTEEEEGEYIHMASISLHQPHL